MKLLTLIFRDMKLLNAILIVKNIKNFNISVIKLNYVANFIFRKIVSSTFDGFCIITRNILRGYKIGARI